ncbi:MAG TPA: helix-turn-helix domain-containing protein, partial [Longilinea sp.]|nr:helix-turn-helix domain-containing protein [Longilinea sp.]
MVPTVGEQLKAAREQRHLSLEEVANNTHIRLQFLRAIEENRLDELSSKAQVRGFIRLYASSLGIPVQPLLDTLEEKPLAEPHPEAPTVAQSFPAETTGKPTEMSSTEYSFADEEEAVPEFPPAVEPDYQTIYNEIGQQLRQRREALSLSLDDISLHTRLKKNVLEALEEGQFDSLPSPVQARGLLNNYARFLNLDVDAVLLR